MIQHIILSHHGEPEFGAARIPSTPEAIAVHTIENLDAKLMMALALTRGDASLTEANWTDWQKAFNGRLYRPDVAPAETAADSAAEQPPASPAPPPAAEKVATEKPAGALKLNNPLFENVTARKH